MICSRRKAAQETRQGLALGQPFLLPFRGNQRGCNALKMSELQLTNVNKSGHRFNVCCVAYMRKKQYLCIRKQGKRAPPETGPQNKDAKMTPCKVITISWETGNPISKVTSYHNSLEEAKRQVRYNRYRAILNGVWETWLIKPEGQQPARYPTAWQPPTK